MSVRACSGWPWRSSVTWAPEDWAGQDGRDDNFGSTWVIRIASQLLRKMACPRGIINYATSNCDTRSKAALSEDNCSPIQTKLHASFAYNSWVWMLYLGLLWSFWQKLHPGARLGQVRRLSHLAPPHLWVYLSLSWVLGLTCIFNNNVHTQEFGLLFRPWGSWLSWGIFWQFEDLTGSSIVFL